MTTLDARDAIAEGVLATKSLLGRYLLDFDDSSGVTQAPGLPNHVIWTLGHLAFTMHRMSEHLDGKPVPTDSFTPGMVGSSRAFAIERVRFGSTPVSDASLYPPLSRAIEVYEQACDRVARGARSANDATLAKHVPWGGGTTPVFLLAQRMIFHNGTHAGQISDLRRVLKMAPVIGPAPSR